MNADNKLLIAIRGYDGWTSDLEVGMIAASRHGRLQSAYESARARYFAEAGQGSKPRVVVKVMAVKEQPVFIAIFRDELRKALSEETVGLTESK